MHKVMYTRPRAIDPSKRHSLDPKDFTAERCAGWYLDIEPEPLILDKDVRGVWSITDPITGYSVSGARFKTRKDALMRASEWSTKLHEFKECNQEHYARIVALTEALAHDLQVLENARSGNGIQ